MSKTRKLALAVVAAVTVTFAVAQAQKKEAPPFRPTADQITEIRTRLDRLGAALRKVQSHALYHEAAVYHKAGEWILRHPEEFYTKAYYDNTLKVLDAGMSRVAELEKGGKPSWTAAQGRTVARAYRSRVDGSLQPYTVTLPAQPAAGPMRLDVILHGRSANMNEVSFLAAAEAAKPATHQDRIELNVYGRTNNAYRWSGETDVLEAMADVKRHYSIDDNRVLLRGFSMGGAGTWHLGLHYPHLWAGIEAGAGFSETLRYAKADAAAEHEKRTWPIYDSYLYARNALLVPTVGYGSIDDPQLQASVNVKEQLAKESGVEGLRAKFLVGPKIGHKFAPESKQESEAFLTANLPRTIPNQIRFLTYTTRYGRYAWFLIDGMGKHYDRAEVEATRDGHRATITTSNVTRLVFDEPLQVTVDGQSLSGPVKAIERDNGRWRSASANGGKLLRKRHGLQGPIDDAFLDSFLCVKGNAPDAQMLDTFRANWDKFLRGDIRIKSDTAVTDADIRDHNLVLFGDSKSNKLIAKVLPKLPVKWDSKGITVAGKRFDGEGLLLSAIYPNPLNPNRYVVLNSGHTFGEKEFRGTNALLYPRLGDWAVRKADGELLGAGFFDESWR